jgi:C4-dicarboxylate transporter DctM subunit
MTVLILGSVFGLMFFGVPVAYAILMAGIIIFTVTGIQPLFIVAQRTVTGMDSFPLLAIPLFILVGNLMDKGGISRRLINFAESLVGFLRGGLGYVTVITCTIFAALTGSGPATVAAIGGTMIPNMEARGFPKRTAAGLVTAAGALGPIIPPSIPMIIYGCNMNLSIPQMFIGGILPGLLIAGLLMTVNAVITRRTPSISTAPIIPFSLKRLLKTTFSAFGALLMPVIILGGIYSGIFTPTEAAAVAVVYGLIVGFAYRELKIRELPKLLVDSIRVSCITVFICGVAKLLMVILAAARVTNTMVSFLSLFIHNRFTYLIVLNLFLFIVGCLLDTIGAIIIIAPLLVPLGLQLGIDPLHLGVLFVINLVIGFVTPPFGYNIFTAVSISGLRFEQVVKGSLPFLAVEIVAVLLIAFVPDIVLFLPRILAQ